ncbi:bifunctional (p)ppGpp synthetase/guanosine-3',5'-bis(diphosphate) 3'-pyrophosphohydrolase, partial [bacterium]|nr:bifunctional (p)ppGpp synthetase/guanosine-3',5'-bis(diphosphate) 3'-pyrophosphohydrolase [bacterium]
DSKLKNGDIVEILTTKVSAPKLGWLNFVVTKQASSKIRQWFKKNKREDHIELGKSTIEHELTKAVFEEKLKNGDFNKVAKHMNYSCADDLFAALGYGETTLNKILNKLNPPEKNTEPKFKKEHKYSKKKDIEGLEGMLYSFARCCSPIPGEPIVGVVTRSKGVTVHRLDCKTLNDIEPERLIDIKWSGESSDRKYTTSIRIETAEKQGLLKDIITVVADNNTNIVFANVKSRNNTLGIIELGIELDNINTLKSVMNCLQSMPEVYTVKRVQTAFNQAPKQFAKKNKNFAKKNKSPQNPR